MRRFLAALLALALLAAPTVRAQPMGGGRILVFEDGVQVSSASVLDFWNFVTQLADGRLEIHLPTATSFFGSCVGDVCGETCGTYDACSSTVDVGDGKIIMPTGTNLPATCTASEYFFATSTLAAYVCTATNTWTLIAALGSQVATADTTIGNTATETILCSLAIAANTVPVGRTYRLVAGGRLTTGASGTHIFNARLRMGTNAADTIVSDPGVTPTLTAGVSNKGWHYEGTVTIRTVNGASSTATATSVFYYPTVSGTGGAVSTLADTLTTSTTTIDVGDATFGVALWGKWTNAAHANQLVTLDTCTIEQVK